MEKVVTSIVYKYIAIYALVFIDYLMTCMIFLIIGEPAERNPWLGFLMRHFHSTHAIGYAKWAGVSLLGFGLMWAVSRKNLVMLERINRWLTWLTLILFVIACYVGYIWIQLS